MDGRGLHACAWRSAAISWLRRLVSVPGAGGRFWGQGSIAQLALTVPPAREFAMACCRRRAEAAPRTQPLPQTLDHLPGQRGNHCGLIMWSDADAILEATTATLTRDPWGENTLGGRTLLGGEHPWGGNTPGRRNT